MRGRAQHLEEVQSPPHVTMECNAWGVPSRNEMCGLLCKSFFYNYIKKNI